MSISLSVLSWYHNDVNICNDCNFIIQNIQLEWSHQCELLGFVLGHIFIIVDFFTFFINSLLTCLFFMNGNYDSFRFNAHLFATLIIMSLMLIRHNCECYFHVHNAFSWPVWGLYLYGPTVYNTTSNNRHSDLDKSVTRLCTCLWCHSEGHWHWIRSKTPQAKP